MRKNRRKNGHAAPARRRRGILGDWPGMGVLSSLGVFGLGPIEDGFLAGLALGEPILLVGNIGCAKTMLAERVAWALGLRFHAYDASKAVFEDVIGFPDPRAMQKGHVDYLQSPITLWDKEFILVDELSRAMPGMQNKWLEVIQSRRIMGVPLPDLRYVVAAMNPVGLLGTLPLDDALAGRFTFVLDVPEIHDFSEEDRRIVIETAAIGWAKSPPSGEGGSTASRDLDRLLGEVRGAIPRIREEMATRVTTYVDKVREHLLSRDARLDGRRVGMMHRAILALCSLHRVTGRLEDGTLPLDLFRHALDMTLPFRATGVEVPRMLLNAAHAYAAAALEGRKRALIGGPHLLPQVERFLHGPEDQDAASLLVSRVVTALDRPSRVEPTVEAAAALCRMMARPDLQERLSPDARQRLWAAYRDVTSLEPSRISEFRDAAAALDLETEWPDPTRNAVLRMAFHLAERLDRSPAINCSFEDFAPRLVAEVAEGGVT